MATIEEAKRELALREAQLASARQQILATSLAKPTRAELMQRDISGLASSRMQSRALEERKAASLQELKPYETDIEQLRRDIAEAEARSQSAQQASYSYEDKLKIAKKYAGNPNVWQYLPKDIRKMAMDQASINRQRAIYAEQVKAAKDIGFGKLADINAESLSKLTERQLLTLQDVGLIKLERTPSITTTEVAAKQQAGVISSSLLPPFEGLMGTKKNIEFRYDTQYKYNDRSLPPVLNEDALNGVPPQKAEDYSNLERWTKQNEIKRTIEKIKKAKPNELLPFYKEFNIMPPTAVEKMTGHGNRAKEQLLAKEQEAYDTVGLPSGIERFYAMINPPAGTVRRHPKLDYYTLSSPSITGGSITQTKNQALYPQYFQSGLKETVTTKELPAQSVNYSNRFRFPYPFPPYEKPTIKTKEQYIKEAGGQSATSKSPSVLQSIGNIFIKPRSGFVIPTIEYVIEYAIGRTRQLQQNLRTNLNAPANPTSYPSSIGFGGNVGLEATGIKTLSPEELAKARAKGSSNTVSGTLKVGGTTGATVTELPAQQQKAVTSKSLVSSIANIVIRPGSIVPIVEAAIEAKQARQPAVSVPSTPKKPSFILTPQEQKMVEEQATKPRQTFPLNVFENLAAGGYGLVRIGQAGEVQNLLPILLRAITGEKAAPVNIPEIAKQAQTAGKIGGPILMGTFFGPAFETAAAALSESKFSGLGKELNKEASSKSQEIFASIQNKLINAKNYEEQLKILKALKEYAKTPEQKAGFVNLLKDLASKNIIKAPSGEMLTLGLQQTPRQALMINLQTVSSGLVPLKGVGTLLGILGSIKGKGRVTPKETIKEKELPSEKQKSILSVGPLIALATTQRAGSKVGTTPVQKQPQPSTSAQPEIQITKQPVIPKEIPRQITKQQPRLKQPSLSIMATPETSTTMMRFPISPTPFPISRTTQDETTKALEELKGKGVDILVGMERGKQKIIAKNLPPFKALKKAAQFVDENIEASFRLKPTGKTPSQPDIPSFSIGQKFRPSKRNALFVVEKRRFRLDMPNERRQIKLKKQGKLNIKSYSLRRKKKR